MPVVPPPDPKEAAEQITIRTTVGRVAELDLLCAMSQEHQTAAFDGYSRNEIANFLWEAGLEQFWKERGQERPQDAVIALKSWREKHPPRKSGRK